MIEDLKMSDVERRLQALEAVVKALTANDVGKRQHDRITKNLQSTIASIPASDGSDILAKKLTDAVEALREFPKDEV